jgi:hypothetical protein
MDDVNPYIAPENTKVTVTRANTRSVSIALMMGVLGISLAVMGVCPVLAIGLGTVLGIFDNLGEYVFVFGGVTALFLLPFSFVLVVSDDVFSVAVLVVWCVVLVAPALLLPRLRGKRTDQTQASMLILFGLQFVFSFAQAGMGVLLLLGKSC